MTKPKNRPAPIPGARAAAAGALPADTSAAGDNSETLQQLLEQFGDGAGYSARVERTRDAGMRPELAGYLGVLQFGPELYEDVQRTWGGGKYRVRIYQGADYQASLTFQVAGEPRLQEPEAAPVAESQTEKLLRQLLAKLDAPAQVSPLTQFAEFARLMRELNPPPAPVAPVPAQDPLAMFKLFDTMLDLRQRVAEETGERPADNGIGTIVRDGIQPLIALVREKMALDHSAARTGNGAAAPAAGRRVSSSPAAAADPIAQLCGRIPAMGRAFLSGAARAKKDPALYAELVLDQIPEADYATLPALLSEPDCIQRMLSAVPEWAPFPVWFTELGRAMYQSLTSEIVVEPPAAGEPDQAAADVHANGEQPAAATV